MSPDDDNMMCVIQNIKYDVLQPANMFRQIIDRLTSNCATNTLIAIEKTERERPPRNT